MVVDTEGRPSEYWQSFKSYGQGSALVRSGSSERAYIHWWPKSGFKISGNVRFKDGVGRVQLSVEGESSKQYYRALHRQRDVIHRDLGFDLVWVPDPADDVAMDRQSRKSILVDGGPDPNVKAYWPWHHAWLLDHLEAYHSVFGDYIERL